MFSFSLAGGSTGRAQERKALLWEGENGVQRQKVKVPGYRKPPSAQQAGREKQKSLSFSSLQECRCVVG